MLKRTKIGAAVGAAFVFGFQAPAVAGFINYTYTGTVTDAGDDATPTFLNKAFTASVRIDTTANSVVEFTYTVNTIGDWTGTGGDVSATPTQFFIDLASSSYTSTAAGDSIGAFHLLDLEGPTSAFGTFVDGYATTFNVGSMTTRGGIAYICSSNIEDFGGNFTTRLDSVTAEVEPATVSEPGTLALAALAGLAALRGARRRKAAIA